MQEVWKGDKHYWIHIHIVVIKGNKRPNKDVVILCQEVSKVEYMVRKNFRFKLVAATLAVSTTS